MAAIGVDAGDQRHTVADLVAGLVHHAGLFVKRAGMDFRGVAIDGDGCDTVDIGGKREMAPGFCPVELEIRIERGECRRDDTMGDVVFETCHVGSPAIREDYID